MNEILINIINIVKKKDCTIEYILKNLIKKYLSWKWNKILFEFLEKKTKNLKKKKNNFYYIKDFKKRYNELIEENWFEDIFKINENIQNNVSNINFNDINFNHEFISNITLIDEIIEDDLDNDFDEDDYNIIYDDINYEIAYDESDYEIDYDDSDYEIAYDDNKISINDYKNEEKANYLNDILEDIIKDILYNEIDKNEIDKNEIKNEIDDEIDNIININEIDLDELDLKKIIINKINYILLSLSITINNKKKIYILKYQKILKIF